MLLEAGSMDYDALFSRSPTCQCQLSHAVGGGWILRPFRTSTMCLLQGSSSKSSPPLDTQTAPLLPFWAWKVYQRRSGESRPGPSASRMLSSTAACKAKAAHSLAGTAFEYSLMQRVWVAARNATWLAMPRSCATAPCNWWHVDMARHQAHGRKCLQPHLELQGGVGLHLVQVRLITAELVVQGTGVSSLAEGDGRSPPGLVWVQLAHEIV